MQLNERIEDEASMRPGAKRRGRAQVLDVGGLIDASPAPMWLFDTESLSFLHVNRAAEEKYGYTREQFLSMTLADIRPAEDRDELAEVMAEDIAGPGDPIQVRHVTREGRLLDVAVCGSSVRYLDRDARLVVVTDLTAQRAIERELEDLTSRTEECLRENEARFRQVVESIQEVFWMFSPDFSEVLYVSPEYERVFGQSAAELRANPSSFLNCIHPDDAAEVHAAMATLISGRIEKEFRLLMPDGTVRWLSLQGGPILNDQGEVYRLAGVTEDITARKVASETLLRREQQLAEAEKIAQIGSWEWDAESGALRWSPNLYRLYGIKAGAIEATREAWLERVHPEDRQALARRIAESVESGKEGEMTFRIIRGDGEVRTMVSRARVLKSATGKLLRVYGVSRDATDGIEAERGRVLAEETVARRERQLAKAEEIARVGSWEWDLKTNHVRWSDNLFRIQGVQEVPADGFPPNLSVQVREQLTGVVERTLWTHEAFELEFDAGFPGGETRYFIARGEVVLGEDGPVRFIGVTQDITERRRAEEELRAAMEVAETSNRSKSHFLSRMSHELRTPLNAILGFAQVLDLEMEEAQDRECVEYILKAGRHLLTLIDDVMDLSRMETGNLAFTIERVGVREMVAECVSLMAPIAQQRRVQLVWNGKADELYLEADRQRLKEVMLNLLSNAIKYNRPDGKVTIRAAETADRRVTIAVTDTGRGIPIEMRHRVFVPFDRLDAERSKTEGTGLGLSLAKSTVERMAGEIGFDGVPGEGTTFWVRLPASPAAPGADPAQKDHRPEPRWRILCIDGSVESIELMREILAGRPGAELVAVMQAEQGLQLAREHRPDVILLDVRLPDSSGEEVLRALQRDPATWTIPVLLISGGNLPEALRADVDAGTVKYHQKPFDVPDFLDTLDDLLTP